MKLHSVRQKLPTNSGMENIDRLLKESIDKSRRLSHELSAPVLQQFGLIAALEWLFRQMDEQFGLKVTLDVEAGHNYNVASLKVLLFRAVQELLFNIVKHSGVKIVFVSLSCPGNNLVITVSDHGQGFDPEIMEGSTAKAGLGLLSLRERASAIGGSLDIQSKPGRGSRFILTVPRDLAESGGK